MSDHQGAPSSRAGETQAPLIISLSIIPTVLSTASVALRLYTRKTILRSIGPEDYAIVVAQFLAVGVAVLNILHVYLGGNGRHIETVSKEEFLANMKILLSLILVYNAAQLATKVSFLIQYRRLFPSHVVQKICTYGLIFLGLWGVSQQIYSPFSCYPLQQIFPYHKKCINTTLIYNFNAIMNMVTDFFILLIPIYPVLQLQINKKRKLHLLAVFSLGFIACAISIIRLNELHRTDPGEDDTWNSSATAWLSVIELSIGILCACVPTLRPLVKKIAPRLLGSSQNESTSGRQNYRMSGLSTVRTKKGKTEQNSGIYIQKEVEFHSTTELRSNTSTTKDPYALPERSSDDVSIQEIQVVSTAKAKNSPAYSP